MLKSLFECVDNINNKLENKILEITINQSSISIVLKKGNMLSLEDVEALNTLCNQYSITSINALDGEMSISFNNLTQDLVDNSFFGRLYGVIFKLTDVLCSCPALTYVISESYIKVYIDVPNIHISNLEGVRKLFNDDGLLETGMHKPYILFVKDW